MHLLLHLCKSMLCTSISRSTWQSHHSILQVTIPVEMAGQGTTSISILSLHKSDMRLLHLAAKLGPLIAEAAQDVAVAMAEEQSEHDGQQQASATGRYHSMHSHRHESALMACCHCAAVWYQG